MSHVHSVRVASGLAPPITDRIDEGEAAIFERLYQTALPRVYAIVRHQVATPEVAQEIVSRVFLKACQNRHKIPPGDQGLHWIVRVAQNTLIDYWRVEGRRERANVSVNELSNLPSFNDSPEEAYYDRQKVTDLLQLVSDLADDDRMMLSLKFVAERTNREIAAILHISEAAVAMRLLRALRRLRDRLRQIGWHDGT